jgi:type I restriction enzyme, S subunit
MYIKVRSRFEYWARSQRFGERNLTMKPSSRFSGIAWIGNIPNNWSIASLKKYASYISRGKSPEYADKGIPIINQACIYWDGLKLENVKFQDPNIVNGHKGKLYYGDLLINSTGTGTLGRLGVFNIDEEYFADSHVTIVRPKKELLTKYLYYLLQTNIYQGYIYSVISSGATNQIELSREGLSNTPIIVPPFQVQKAIAHFLDRKTAAIETLIAKKQRLIQLLEEKRTALINQAVTKGLNPDVPMKDSGIPWIGKIPEHWKVKRFKFLINYLEQGWSPSCENRLVDEQEWGILKVGCVNGGYFDELEHKALPSDLQPKLEYKIKTGDILVSRANTKELLGSAAKVHAVHRKLLLCDKLYRLKIVSSVDSAFFVILLQSKCARYQFERDSSGASSSMQNISQESMKDFLFPLASLQEQHFIVNILDKNFQSLDDLKFKLLNQIRKLQEYRQSLITAAVTGKIDIKREEAT